MLCFIDEMHKIYKKFNSHTSIEAPESLRSEHIPQGVHLIDYRFVHLLPELRGYFGAGYKLVVGNSDILTGLGLKKPN